MLLLLIAARIPFDSREAIAVLSVGWSSIAKVLNKPGFSSGGRFQPCWCFLGSEC